MSWAMVSLPPDRRSTPPTQGRYNTRACSPPSLARGLLSLLAHERPRRHDEAPPPCPASGAIGSGASRLLTASNREHDRNGSGCEVLAMSTRRGLGWSRL